MRRTICAVLAATLMSFSASALSVSARSAALIDAHSGSVLFQKQAEIPLGMASTTKIMTAIVAIENCDLNRVYEIPAQACATEGTAIYLKAGEKLTIGELLYGLMLNSGNDAANALALATSGEISRFVSLMNQKARDIAMTDTCFKNPSGLPAKGHYSTALDMARLAAYAMRNEQFRRIVSTKSISAAGRTFKNHNRMLLSYDGADGIKTGFTKSSGRCLVTSACRGETRFIAVTLNAPDDWRDHTAMLDYAFSEFESRSVLKGGESVASVSVVGAERATSVDVRAVGDMKLLCRKGENIACKLLLPKFIYAPVKSNQVIGSAVVISNGKVVASTELAAGSSVTYYEKPGFFRRILNYLWRKNY